jgi:putative chitinase
VSLAAALHFAGVRRATADLYAPIILNAAIDAGMEELELQHFLAQAMWESGNFESLEENLNYSAARLMEVWPSRYPAWKAQECAFNPPCVGETSYGGRSDLGNTEPGDGYKFRGRGLFQLTGRHNYTRCEEGTGLPLTTEPQRLLSPDGAVASAVWYWRSRPKCREGALADDAKVVTYAINGGYHGLAGREARLEALRAMWPPPVPPSTVAEGRSRLVVFYDLDAATAWKLLWGSLRAGAGGNRMEVSIESDWRHTLAPLSDGEGQKLMLRQGQ